ncbi:hypothetical protein MTO96_009404 [Rhipicephalus appendiculatus]
MKPPPKNMNPAQHSGRREARAKAYEWLLAGQKGISFTDASKARGKIWATATVTTKDELLTCATAKSCDSAEAEEMAVALALTIPGTTRVVTDSQQAYISFQSDIAWLARSSSTAARCDALQLQLLAPSTTIERLPPHDVLRYRPCDGGPCGATLPFLEPEDLSASRITAIKQASQGPYGSGLGSNAKMQVLKPATIFHADIAWLAALIINSGAM